MKLLITATVISTAIQVPFLLMLNMGVHSKIGGFGYLFYYPWIALLDHLGTTAWRQWQNDLLVFEAVLLLLQSLVLVPLISGVLLIRRDKSNKIAK
jgi:hypothetical protein